jgi:spoIIIJ-associated protein
MEWVETTARSVDEAKELALDQLGVAEDDAEFEVLDEPKAGLFGRIRGEARVRARVRPTQARQKVDRRDRKRKKDDVAAEGSTTDVVPADTADAPSELKASRARAPRAPKVSAGAADVDSETTETPARPESRSVQRDQPPVDAKQVGDEARRFVEELVHAFGLTGTAELVEDGDDLEVQVHGTELGLLVGPKGSTLQAVQDLARVASQRRLGDHDTRLRVDIGGYRVRRREALGRFATQVAGEVTSSGTARALEPMSSSDRKIIHDTLSEMAGVSTRSEGDDPNRRVVIDPVSA